MLTAEEIIKFFGMEPLPNEGGFYVERYRAEERIGRSALPGRYEGERVLGTAILYLITADKFSRLHRLKSDEVFHFYLGDAVLMLHLRPNGSSNVVELGQDITNGQQVQVTVPRGIWQGCLLKEGGTFALMGCTVAPGFEFSDFELGDRRELLEKYPTQGNLIVKLT